MSIAFISLHLSGDADTWMRRKKEKKETTLGKALIELQKISGDLAMRKITLLTDTKSTCLFSNIFTGVRKSGASKKGGEGEPLDKAIKGMFENEKKRCVILKELKKYTDEIYRQVLKTKEIKTELYTFNVFDEEPDGESLDSLYRKVAYGVFLTMEDCLKFENAFRTAGSGTDKCVIWKKLY